VVGEKVIEMNQYVKKFGLPVGIIVILLLAGIAAIVVSHPVQYTPAKTTSDASVTDSNSESVVVTAGLVATPITNLIPVPADVKTTGSYIDINNPPKILKVTGTSQYQNVYLTNIVFDRYGFAADIENRGPYEYGWFNIFIGLEHIPGAIHQKFPMVTIPAGEKVRFEGKFEGLQENQRNAITTAGIQLNGNW